MPLSLSPEQNALRIIHDEHGNLASIIRGMQYFVREIDQGKPAPDLKVFRAMLYYINEFPDRVHHPKEDHYLFARLRNRSNELDDAITDLERQHRKGTELVHRLNNALTRYEFDGSSAFLPFRAQVADYAGFYFSHMRQEEEVILPAASRLLLPEDWKEIEAAFASNCDALTGIETKSDFDRLFSLIVNITPAPMGFGDSLN